MRPNSKALKARLGSRVVVRVDGSGYQVNPDQTGTKELDPRLEQAVIESLAFQPGARFPRVTDAALVETGAMFVFQGF